MGDQLAGRYRLDQRLGQGGMGEVWRAHDTALERAVAVKVLLEAATNDEVVAHGRLLIVVTPPPDESGGFSPCRVGGATDQPGP
ncbi:hypothetical protein [Streptomyces sp. NBC_00096]|uniref:hypothetical protein n=1 Tax=Streptomyces sp. NBC_00096 TaxID=2975650 RepID=UPI00325620BD